MRYRIRTSRPVPHGSKYPIGLLEPGQSFFVPVRPGEDIETVKARILSAVTVWRETHREESVGRVFTVQVDVETKRNGGKRVGIGCWRKS